MQKINTHIIHSRSSLVTRKTAQEGIATNPEVMEQTTCRNSLISCFSMPRLYILQEMHKARGVPAHWKGSHLQGSGEKGQDFGDLAVDQLKEECNVYTDCELANYTLGEQLSRKGTSLQFGQSKISLQKRPKSCQLCYKNIGTFKLARDYS